MPRKRLIESDYKLSALRKAHLDLEPERTPPPMEFEAFNNLNFRVWYGIGLDEIAKEFHRVLWDGKRTGLFADRHLYHLYHTLSIGFFTFLQEYREVQRRKLQLSDITPGMVKAFLDWLKHLPAKTKSKSLGYTTQKKIYDSCATVLRTLGREGLVLRGEVLLPRMPFPGSKRRGKRHKPYSSSETERLLTAIARELRESKDGKLHLTPCQVLVHHLLLIAARSGRNTTPLLELTRDSLRDHPIKPNRRLLVTFKRRGYNTDIQSFMVRPSGRQLESITTVSLDVVSLYENVIKLSDPLLSELPESERENLWVYRSVYGRMIGQVRVLSAETMGLAIKAFVKRNQLRGDDGNPLSVTISRLRKTFVNRLWELTGGNTFAVAQLAGHTVDVSDSMYLAAPPEAKRNFKWCGEALVEKLRNEASASEPDIGVATPVARCGDPLHGKFAPKDGKSYCMDFLNCFRCPSQIITVDDLWRIFSFYWLLIRERAHLPRNQWSKRYAWVIREIDRVTAAKFRKADVDQARNRARTDPHPMWRDRDAILLMKG